MIYLNYPLLKANTYSLEEQMIGVWYDGRPLYRMVFEVTTPSTTAQTTVATTTNDKNVVKIDGYYNYNDKQSASVNFTDFSSNPVSGIMTLYRRGLIEIIIGSTKYANKSGCAIIEYTKPTDQPLISTTEILSAYLKNSPQSDLQELASIASKTLTESEIKAENL